MLLAAELANADGGVDGRPIELVSTDVAAAEAAPAAVEQFDADGIDLVLGSYGSTISAPASEAAAARDMLFWETGAVGMLPGRSEPGRAHVPRAADRRRARTQRDRVHRADRSRTAFGRDPSDLRYAVSFVDDVYGRSVAGGALQAAREQGLDVVGRFGYDLATADYDAARAAHRPLAAPTCSSSPPTSTDAIALRRALVRNDVDLLASIGTSSSYCMPEFGAALGADALGLFASDKPSGDAIDPVDAAPRRRGPARARPRPRTTSGGTRR